MSSLQLVAKPSRRPPPLPPRASRIDVARPSRADRVVTVVYLALVLCTPFLVREAARLQPPVPIVTAAASGTAASADVTRPRVEFGVR